MAALVANRGYAPQACHSSQKVCEAYLANCLLRADSWYDTPHAYVCRNIDDSNLVNRFDPRDLAAKASKYNADSSKWDMVMGGPFKAEYLSTMQTELTTLYDYLKARE